MTAQLSLIDVTKKFGDVIAVETVTLDVQQGEFLTLLGPSGSGKTTTLNMIAGFEIPSSGQILLQDRGITNVAPNNRGIGSAEIIEFPPSKFCLDQYRKFFTHPGWQSAVLNSLQVAFLTSIASTTLGLLASIALVWESSRQRVSLRDSSSLP